VRHHPGAASAGRGGRPGQHGESRQNESGQRPDRRAEDASAERREQGGELDVHENPVSLRLC